MTSRRLEAVKPSATMAMTARAIQLRREGRDIVSLSVGEPDFPVFPHVAQAVCRALWMGRVWKLACAQALHADHRGMLAFAP